MPAVAAPYLAGCVMLAGAGVAKGVRPSYTARALQAAGLPATRTLVRLGAVGEIAIAATALVFPGPLTGCLVALSYLVFAAFVAVALRRGLPLTSCGCFGRPDGMPTLAHVVLNAGAAASAIWWATAAPASIPGALASQPWQGAPLALVTVVIAGLAYIVWTNPLAGVDR